MNRRVLLKALAGSLVGAATVTQAQPPRWGQLTLERYSVLRAQGVHLHVFHQGVDITRQCRYADDTGDGMAERYVYNEQGRRYLDTSRRCVATEIVTGVTIQEGAPL